MPKISVIVAVYNLEKYITECLESIRHQTYTDYEVIIVNDNSTDKSAEIISNYISEYKLDNFILINKENGGISSVRNKGIEFAQGEWITFIDGDDWVEPSFLADMIADIDKNPVDLSIVGYQVYDMKTQEATPWTNYSLEYGTLPQDVGALYSFGRVWARIYKRSIIEDYHIRFDERIKYCEDDAFNFDYISAIKSFRLQNKIGYNYRVNRDGSLTKKLIHPKIKYHLNEHMQAFCSTISLDDLKRGLNENKNLSFVMWNVFHTTVINDILDGKLKGAYKYKKTPVSKAIIKAYKPRTKKDKLFRFFCRTSFLCMIILVKIYYGNFEKLRKSKLLKFMS